MKKIDRLSQIILTIIVIIFFSFLFINEDKSWFILIPIFGIFTFLYSFISIRLAKIINNIGNKIRNLFLKILYYIFLPLILIGICILIYYLYEFNVNYDLNRALMILIFIIFLFIIIILPYINALIIILLKKYIKNR